MKHIFTVGKTEVTNVRWQHNILQVTLLLSERDGNQRKIQKLHKTSSFCVILTCAIPVLELIISAEASALYCSVSHSL